MSGLQVRVLGYPRVIHGDSEARFPTRKALALICYLAVSGKPQSREKLGALLWPEADAARSAGSLRRALTHIRESLGGPEHLQASRAGIALAGHHLSTDLDLLDRGEPGDGEFMDGFGVPDAPEFEEWSAVQREYWNARRVACLDLVSARLLATGRISDAAAMAARWVAQDPLDERAHHRLIYAYLSAGEGRAALSAYRACERLLATGLGVEPEQATKELGELARQRTSPAPQTADLPMVGRAYESVRLEACLGETARGPHAVLISGEAGIGKSRLAFEFERRVYDHIVVLRAGAFETGAGLPHQPLLEVLRSGLAELPKLDHLGRQPAPGRIQEAIAEAFLDLFGGGPAVLILDDIQWFDAASLVALIYVAQRLRAAEARVLLLLLARDDEPAAASRLTAWLAKLEREIEVSRLHLEPLTPSDLSGLSENPAELHRDTGGHPLLVVEMLRAGGTGRVAELIASRLDSAGANARRVLEAAAVLDAGATAARLQVVAALNEPKLEAALEELQGRKLLREVSGRYAFAHDTFRETAYRRLSAVRRRELHRRALAAGGEPADLARHALGAGAVESFRDLAWRAGEQAMALSAPADAIAHFEAVRALGPPLPDGLHQGLGRAYELVDDWTSARSIYDELLLQARARGDGRLEVAALNRLATLAALEGQQQEAIALQHRALSVALAASDRVGEVECRLSLAVGLIQRLDLDGGLRQARAATAQARRLPDRSLEARCLSAVSLAHHLAGRWAESGRAAARALPIYRELGDAVMAVDAETALAAAAIRTGQLARGLTYARQAWMGAHQIGNSWGIANSGFHLALGLADAAELAEALEIAEEAHAAAELVNYVPLRLLLLGLRGNIRRAAGDVPGALTDHLAARAMALPQPLAQDLVLSDLCADHAAAGDWDAALRFARAASSVRETVVLYGGLSRYLEVEALARGGDMDAAQAETERFLSASRRNRRYRIAALRSQAVVARRGGESDVAAAVLAEAHVLARSTGVRLEEIAIADEARSH